MLTIAVFLFDMREKVETVKTKQLGITTDIRGAADKISQI